MDLPGLITVPPDPIEELDGLAHMVGACFREEMWYATWLEAIDSLGADESRKLEITRAAIYADYAVTAPFQCVYTLPDRSSSSGQMTPSSSLRR